MWLTYSGVVAAVAANQTEGRKKVAFCSHSFICDACTPRDCWVRTNYKSHPLLSESCERRRPRPMATGQNSVKWRDDDDDMLNGFDVQSRPEKHSQVDTFRWSTTVEDGGWGCIVLSRTATSPLVSVEGRFELFSAFFPYKDRFLSISPGELRKPDTYSLSLSTEWQVAWAAWALQVALRPLNSMNVQRKHVRNLLRWVM